MIRFAHIYFLWLLWLIPIIVGLYIIYIKNIKKNILLFGDSTLLARLIPDASPASRNLKLIFYLFALVLIIFSLSSPQIGSKIEKAKRKGIDLMVLLDVSNSMMAQDIQPNRLERAKQSLSKLVDRLENDRIGIIIFAGKAYTQLPITNDYAAAKLFISNISTDLVAEQGTAIGSAIDLAVSTFDAEKDKSGNKNKAIIIISDGENHEDDAIESSRKAESMGIVINTIGMGLTDGVPIPIYNNGIAIGFKKDMSGNTVVTKLDEVGLQQIAVIGKGIYTRASNATVGLDKIFDRLEKLEKKEFDSALFSDYEDRFQYPLFLALVLIIAEYFINERRKKYINNMNLFDKGFINK